MICPTGTRRKILSSRLRKNIPLRDLLKSALLNPMSRPTRGAYRDRHGRWVRDAMDAERRAQSLRGRAAVCGRRSRVVLAPRRWCQVGGRKSADDGGKKARSPGSTKEPVKTIAQGRPVDPAPPVLTTVCFLPMHTGRGCEPSTRPSLRPPGFRGWVHAKPRAQRVAGTRSRIWISRHCNDGGGLTALRTQFSVQHSLTPAL